MAGQHRRPTHPFNLCSLHLGSCGWLSSSLEGVLMSKGFLTLATVCLVSPHSPADGVDRAADIFHRAGLAHGP